jgi:hypothetical protein
MRSLRNTGRKLSTAILLYSCVAPTQNLGLEL